MSRAAAPIHIRMIHPRAGSGMDVGLCEILRLVLKQVYTYFTAPARPSRLKIKGKKSGQHRFQTGNFRSTIDALNRF